ncbi:hypothetical protein MO867_17500 [Microbulbifer sp. OS29]|uniref:Uncharacterized protein n=1 Tax=Microbulbifer okhotskensis TaxID=2926617 RepID=A0A9X2EQW4_9GAMM|nr:hypothetical protein [Microbulbifer okhotskensis]MCO1336130.1 hypothetical protein [Microbulbifer okhotskensis]
MDLKTTTPSHQNPKATKVWRLTISLIISIGLHIVLITIPISLVPDPDPAPPPSTRLKIKLLTGQGSKISPVVNADKIEAEKAPALTQPNVQKLSKSTPNSVSILAKDKPATNLPPQDLGRLMENQNKIHKRVPPSSISAVGSRVLDAPIGPEMRRQPAVFDPYLEKKLTRERSKIRRFKPVVAKYKTNTGTFTQVGDRCFDVKELPAGITDSDLNSWFKVKCPNNSRPQENIDRLAEKYGIP